MDVIRAPLVHRLGLLGDAECERRRVPHLDRLDEGPGREDAVTYRADSRAVNLGPLRIGDAGAEKPIVRLRQGREGDDCAAKPWPAER